jgi:hypothetical protein
MIEYRKITPEAHKAWLQWKKDNPNIKYNVVAFVAGYNAAKAEKEKK